jgi:hypothetical protein
MIVAAAGVIFLLLVGVAGYSIYQSRAQNTSLVGSATTTTPSTAASPTAASPSPAVQLPLTAELGGEYCPVAHVNQTACWRGTLVNTGPQIGKLAMTFVTGGGYTNWFSTHSSPALSGFYTTPGCVLDISHARMLCGAVPRGGHVTVYLSADTSKAGTFHYAVKFADVSYGTPDYIDQNPDGTHRIVAWTESIIA